MTVSELIEQLAKLPSGARVLVVDHDDDSTHQAIDAAILARSGVVKLMTMRPMTVVTASRCNQWECESCLDWDPRE